MTGGRGWIGVDLDGTLTTWTTWTAPDVIGEPIKEMCDRVRWWLKEGLGVKIFTARASCWESNEVIQAFCLDQFGTVLEITDRKDHQMVEMWDDRAVRVERNTGRRVL